jgi:DALR anticodon binding domain
MDTNVSKNTNSHNFFKLQLNQEKLGISVKNLLKQELLLILDLYQQKLNVQIEPKLVTTILSAKLKIAQPKNNPSLGGKSIINSYNHGSPAKFLPIIYACPLGMSLSANLQLSPQTIMEQLICLLTAQQDQLEPTDQDFPAQLLTEIVPLGWLNFYLDSQLIANWLQRSLCWSQANSIKTSNRVTCTLDQTPAQLFPAQYIHGRCCSLLALGAREAIISLWNDDAAEVEPSPVIPWLDPEHKLWFTEIAEYNLLQQLLQVSDSWLENSENTDVHHDPKHWSKMVLNLSQMTAIFLAECRFLGEVKQRYPQKAIARLGLIALVQFWLEKILVDKLGVAAPKEL